MYTQVTKATYKAAIANTEQGVLICSKNLCPHCKNMEKVLEKFSVQRPSVTFLQLNSEEEPEAMAALGAERAPTILVIKNGNVVATKTGLMNPREMIALYDNAK